ncbi:MAG: MFS transporter [Deltaproteobacteria bacterium]|nr:MFS transporter [Deltaproteobacteria bacterium]
MTSHAPAAGGRTPPQGHDAYQALRYGEYRWYLVGITAVFLGTQMQTLVMGWQVYELTHDALSLGLIGLSEAVPFLALTLLGGHAADRRDRRAISLAAAAVLFAGAAVLVGINLGGGLRSAWPLYAIQGLAGVGRAFYRPASQALATELVPRAVYQNAATWRSSAGQTAMVGGPALGGLLYSLGSARLAYGTEAVMMALGLLALLRVRARPRSGGSTGPVLRSLAEGLRFVFSQRLILSALSLDLFAVLFGGAVALLPAFASDVLGVGPRALGLMRAMPAVGAVLMSLALAHRPSSRRAGVALLWCVAGFGLSWIAFGLSRSFALSLLFLAVGGALDNVSVVLRSTLVQTYTPLEMMGRVQAVNSFFIGSSNELGAFESGLAARLLGLIPSVLFGGAMTLVVVGATAWKVPELRRLRRIGDEA